MPRADFFGRFGFLQIRDFLDAETCGRLCADIGIAARRPGTIRRRNGNDVDEEVRKVAVANVSPGARALVERRMGDVRPQLERHFGLHLSHHEELSFLRYGPGDFYVPHRDQDDRPAADPEARVRAVSVVAFLNREGDPSDPEGYGGGALTFASLLGDARLSEIGIPLVAEPGLLLAFRSDVLHSVAPVTHGQRYTIVTWFS